MKMLALLGLMAVATVGLAQEPRLWFGFLVKGDAPRPAAEELQRMQQEHIANFQRLHGMGKLLMAGPLADPTTIKRGIVGLWMRDRAEMDESFLPDRYVTTGIMKLEAYPWKMNRDLINQELPDPNAIEENRFVLLTSDRKIPAYLMKQHQAYVQRTLRPSLGGEIEIAGFGEVLMFHGTDTAGIQNQLNADPLVRLGWVKAELMPLWIAKGVLKPQG